MAGDLLRLPINDDFLFFGGPVAVDFHDLLFSKFLKSLNASLAFSNSSK